MVLLYAMAAGSYRDGCDYMRRRAEFCNDEVARELSCRLTTGCRQLRHVSGTRRRPRQELPAVAGQVGSGLRHYCPRLKWPIRVTDLRFPPRLECVSARFEFLLAAPLRIVDHRIYYYPSHPRQAPPRQQYIVDVRGLGRDMSELERSSSRPRGPYVHTVMMSP